MKISLFASLALTVYLLSILVSCHSGSKNNTPFETANDSLSGKDTAVVWINENLGIRNQFQLADTMAHPHDALFVAGFNINIPELVGKTVDFKTINRQIAADFDSVILQAKSHSAINPDQYHTVFYEYFPTDSIISLKITDMYAWHVSEATTTYKIYHFDFKNNKLLSTTEMFAVYGLSQVPVLSAFAEQCTLPPDHSEPLFDTQWFENVKFKNLDLIKFYRNSKQQWVIVYPMAENGLEAECVLE